MHFNIACIELNQALIIWDFNPLIGEHELLDVFVVDVGVNEISGNYKMGVESIDTVPWGTNGTDVQVEVKFLHWTELGLVPLGNYK